MRVDMLDANGEPIVTLWVSAEGYWDACHICHGIIASGVIVGAVDFQILEDT
jgi:hypothetical protein